MTCVSARFNLVSDLRTARCFSPASVIRVLPRFKLVSEKAWPSALPGLHHLTPVSYKLSVASEESPARCAKPLISHTGAGQSEVLQRCQAGQIWQPGICDASLVQIEVGQVRPALAGASGRCPRSASTPRANRSKAVKPATGASPASVIGEFEMSSTCMPGQIPDRRQILDTASRQSTGPVRRVIPRREVSPSDVNLDPIHDQLPHVDHISEVGHSRVGDCRPR